jgi:hypothetical protein
MDWYWPSSLYSLYFIACAYQLNSFVEKFVKIQPFLEGFYELPF